MKKLILLIFALIIVASCKSTKLTNTVVEKVRVDTLRDTTIITKLQAVHDTLTIDNPCDSAGLLTAFYSKIKIPQGQVIIRTVRGKIQATIDIDSIQNVYKNMYRAKQSSDVKISEKVINKTVYPSWLITAFIFETLIILGYIYLKVFYPVTYLRKN